MRGPLLVAAWLMFLMAGCDGRYLDGGDSDGGGASGGGERAPCVEVCQKVRPSLIKHFATPPDRIICTDAKWTAAPTCEVCLEILVNDYAVQATGDFCSGWQ